MWLENLSTVMCVDSEFSLKAELRSRTVEALMVSQCEQIKWNNPCSCWMPLAGQNVQMDPYVLWVKSSLYLKTFFCPNSLYSHCRILHVVWNSYRHHRTSIRTQHVCLMNSFLRLDVGLVTDPIKLKVLLQPLISAIWVFLWVTAVSICVNWSKLDFDVFLRSKVRCIPADLVYFLLLFLHKWTIQIVTRIRRSWIHLESLLLHSERSRLKNFDKPMTKVQLISV